MTNIFANDLERWITTTFINDTRLQFPCGAMLAETENQSGWDAPLIPEELAHIGIIHSLHNEGSRSLGSHAVVYELGTLCTSDNSFSAHIPTDRPP